jgi:hypothetical protein
MPENAFSTRHCPRRANVYLLIRQESVDVLLGNPNTAAGARTADADMRQDASGAELVDQRFRDSYPFRRFFYP